MSAKRIVFIILFNLVFFGGGFLYVLYLSGTFDPPSETEAPPLMPPGDFTLAVSWQPAFCETAPSRPECTSQTEDRFDATYFALHGLWPDPRDNVYCDVPADIRQLDERGNWDALPEVDLTPPLRAALDSGMPGTQSNLHRHEWVKHGTCSGAIAELYYLNSLSLMAALNESGVRNLFAANIGSGLSSGEIRAAFNEAFGDGAGDRVSIDCESDGQRILVSELRISLSGQLGDRPNIGDLARGAQPRAIGCPGGIVDPVGNQ